MSHKCIGCGYCCRKAPCGMPEVEWSKDGCSDLIWDEGKHRWWCREILEATGAHKEYLLHQLDVGKGCGSALNTYRRTRYVPSPAELEQEDVLLKRLNARLARLLAGCVRQPSEQQR